MFRFVDHVKIIYTAAFFGKCFTSCTGIRSGVLAEKQNFDRHFSFLGHLVGDSDIGILIINNYGNLQNKR
jgi:hypothetical protein